ncbi:MAG TPA: STAS domain-containing protein [Planctomycetota bacterium]|nr:STAS domain-containing protein [Planctomycetota bacterium]
MASSEELRIEKETLTGKGIPVLILYGAINVNTFDKLEQAIQDLFKAGKYTLFIDVLNVKYVSSAGAGVLMNAYLQAQEQKGKLVLIRLSPGVRDVLDLLNLHNVIPIADDAPSALKLLH